IQGCGEWDGVSDPYYTSYANFDERDWLTLLGLVNGYLASGERMLEDGDQRYVASCFITQAGSGLVLGDTTAGQFLKTAANHFRNKGFQEVSALLTSALDNGMESLWGMLPESW